MEQGGEREKGGGSADSALSSGDQASELITHS